MTAHILLFTLRVPYFFTIFVRLLYAFMEKLIETIVTGIQDKKGKDIR